MPPSTRTLGHLPGEGRRICGALRIPALVAGLYVGDLTRTYANYGQARKAAYEDCLMPMGRRLAKAMTRALMHEVESQEGDRLGWDYSQVAAPGEDLMNVYRRNNLGVLGGWMQVNEASAKAGRPEDPEGDMDYLCLILSWLLLGATTASVFAVAWRTGRGEWFRLPSWLEGMLPLRGRWVRYAIAAVMVLVGAVLLFWFAFLTASCLGLISWSN